MNMQDRKKSFTVEELRQRYNLDDIEKTKKALELSNKEIKSVGAELENFVEVTTENIQELQDQVDGNITTWFLSGVPTLLNEPAVDWITDTDKDKHLGDLYYDQNTGYAYRFQKSNNVYSWLKLTDSDVTEALAIANAAQDTADSKRRVFVVQPTPPYDIGDIWLKDGKLYRCQTATTSEGTYNPAHWILGVNYTDDTVATQALQELDQYKVEVLQTYATNASLQTTVDSINASVSETYATKTTVNNLDSKLETTKNTINADINTTNAKITAINETINETGVPLVHVETGYTFDIDGLKIEKTDNDVKTVIDNDGLITSYKTEEKLKVNSDGVVAENITTRKFYIQKPIRMEKTKSITDGTSVGLGFFYVGE